MSHLLDQLRQVKVVPVLRSATASEAISRARSLARGGMSVIELTFSTPNVLDAIRELAEDPTLTVGAGTVLTERQARDAVAAGAQFLVSPVWLPWLPDLTDELGVDAIPAGATPSEIWQAHRSGAAAVKVFPIARLGGAAYIRDLLTPIPELALMATGGLDVATARELLQAGCVAVGVGRVNCGDDEDLNDEQRARRFLREVGRAA